ncbi:hypothetical protein L8P27_05085 [Enterobacter asburiae]|uniref:hypothetical protein n=1 Tax=Enterobacter asburiae TaxID=61645 RepID=UPI002006BB93|nr:hypothetical protein [Enterobacter asburiae]MCK7227226.1 hypothetical protein [Enterobacter asburiae]
MNSNSGMTFFGHPVHVLATIVDPDCLLAAPDTLAGWEKTKNCVLEARNRAARSIRRSRKNARKNRQLLAMNREAQLEAEAVEREREGENARKLALQNTVRWLVEETDLEKVVYQMALKKAGDWAIRALQQWQDEIDWSGLLSDRIREMQELLQGETTLVLRLAPGKFADRIMADNALNDESGVQLQMIVDNSLSEKQAILGNHLVRVTIDLEKEFTAVMAQLGAVFSYMEQENGAE